MAALALASTDDDAQVFLEFIAHVRQQIDPAIPVNKRIRNFWASACAACDLAHADDIRREFLKLASESGLRRALGKHADADLGHVLRWAMLGRNPFE